MFRKQNLIVLFALASTIMQAQYISEVLEYKPAPGQFINSSPWGTPSSAHSLIGGINGSMSLGAFGGYVVFKFANPVENDPKNPFGIDFTIFGNPLDNWAEHGIVSVMKDENENGLPDDTWYELAGSEYFFSSTVKNYEVSYTNPGGDTAANVPWADNQGNSGFIRINSVHQQPYYPIRDSFPAVSANNYTLSGTKVASEVDRSSATSVKSHRKAFGYSDSQLRGVAPYTVPDNPYTPERENSGGDAFDIAWAVDQGGEYIDLDSYLSDMQQLHKTVGVLYRPIVKEKGDLYEIEPYKGTDGYADFPLDVALGATLFFYRLSNKLLKDTQTSLEGEKKENLISQPPLTSVESGDGMEV